MPELPEVETITNALRQPLVKRKITGINVFTKMLRYPVNLSGKSEILRRIIVRVSRRAKYIIIELDDLHVITVHLGMTGTLRVETVPIQRRKHDHVAVEFDNGTALIFNDTRKFGFICLSTINRPNSLPETLENLPPEPLTEAFCTDYLYEKFRRHKKPVKGAIMDNNIVAGVGNIYASEALYLSRINPKHRCSSLSWKRCHDLVLAIKTVLAASIKAGGTTISDFRAVDGSEGKYAIQLNAYGKEGEICSRCEKRRIKKIILSGRSTYYCTLCQS